MLCLGGLWPSSAQSQSSERESDVTWTGNPAIAPLKWTGLLMNLEAVEKDGKKLSIACTGQFISSRVVLTAAHCVQNSETGGWYDRNKMYFLLQYQNDSFSQTYRPICISRFDGWWPSQLDDHQSTADRIRAMQNRYQWDYAMILMDRDSSTGHFKAWKPDWFGKYREATVTGYPAALLNGKVIQIAQGELFGLNSLGRPNVVGARHNVAGLAEGSSGGAWVAKFGKADDTDHNIIISLSSFIIKNPSQSGVTFGPYLTAEFERLFDYVSKGCPR
jgi:hypothetical protein